MGYEITLRDRTTELVADADTYAHDKSMTTFYRTANARRTVDCWATPLASVRTEEILLIRLHEAVACTAAPGAVRSVRDCVH
ncbi:MAG: hypothetical protein R2698_09495 [Microthrixaceae bacterium]